MKNTTLEVSYVGSHGVHIPVLADFNQGSTEPVSCNTIAADCLSQQARRPIANFTNILAALPQGYLIYNSLQTKLERRYSNGIYLINSFTWSRAINNASADLETFGGDSAVVNLYNPAADRGPSSYDQPFNNTLSVIADLPFGKGRMFGQSAPAWQQATLGGWQVSAINVVTSGLPINLTYAPTSQVVVSSASATYAVRPNLVSTAKAVYAPKSNWKKGSSTAHWNAARKSGDCADAQPVLRQLGTQQPERPRLRPDGPRAPQNLSPLVGVEQARIPRRSLQRIQLNQL